MTQYARGAMEIRPRCRQRQSLRLKSSFRWLAGEPADIVTSLSLFRGRFTAGDIWEMLALCSGFNEKGTKRNTVGITLAP